MSAPLVSIALVTRNGARTLPAVLEAISEQRVDFQYETVAVDSGSTDGLDALLERSVDRVITIPPEHFNHGLTRNLAIESSRGEFVVLLVQDAIPASDTWLAELTKPLRGDSNVAGAFARQQPHADAGPLARHYLARAEAASGSPRVLQPLTRAELIKLQPMERLARCTFDNVCSCIRRLVWLEIPFKETVFAEDLEWARDVLLAGHSLAFAAEAVVFHSHDRPVHYEWARTLTGHRRLFELFGVQTIPTIPLLARSIARSVLLHLRQEPTLRSLGLAVAWPLGQYMGARSAIQKRPPRRFESV